MTGNPDDYRFKPGEEIRFYQWTPEEVVAAKTFLMEHDPPLCDQLKALEQRSDLETFAGTDEHIRLNRILKKLHPLWQGQQLLLGLWPKMRSLWLREIATTSFEKRD
ncbi:MAG: hypothetical protein H7X92_04505 [Chitinophagales bacterium]|nr:hypothetical protein [Hyphomicrobiales bacterium]